MLYLVTQLGVGLFIAAVLGFVIGFLLSRWFAARNIAELKENYRGKLLNANRKVEIARWEVKVEAGKTQAAADTEHALRFAIAELESEVKRRNSDLAKAEQQMTTQTAGENALAKLADRIGELEQTLSGRNTPESNGDGSRDDLTLIAGIDPSLEKRLNLIGIYTFRQIANWTPDDIQRYERQLPGFSSRVEREKWMACAQEQYSRKYGASSRTASPA
jgi:predicted flap endonuclease-1-like 5' DNA nuclease